METHFTDSTVEEGHLVNTKALDHREEDSIIDHIIEEEKVKRAIQSFGDKKAPGPDGLQPIALKRLPDNIIKLPLLIYRRSLRTGQIPSKWRRMNVIFIPKAGKSEYTSPLVSTGLQPVCVGLEEIADLSTLEEVQDFCCVFLSFYLSQRASLELMLGSPSKGGRRSLCLLDTVYTYH